MDYDPVDEEGIRNAWMQAFRRRGILPEDAPFFSEEALRWPARPRRVQIDGLPFGGPMGLSYEERNKTAEILRRFIASDGNRRILDLAPGVNFRIPSFHPLYRVDVNGSIRWDLVVEVVQTKPGTETSFPIRGGITMIVSTHSTTASDVEEDVFLRYVISKPLDGTKGRARASRQHAYLTDLGIRTGGDPGDTRINFALVHGSA
jgi:hypothetical protein